MNNTTIGLLCAVGAALSFALWNIFLQRAMQKGFAAQAVMLTMGVGTGIFTIPLAVGLEFAGRLPRPTFASVAFFAAAGLMTAAVAPFHSAQATMRIGAGHTTALRLLDPFFAMAIALLFLGEHLSFQAGVGVLLIVGALAMLQRGRATPSAPEEAAAQARGYGAGVLWAIGASLWFSVGTSLRKSGLLDVPAPLIATAVEGVMGLTVWLTWIAVRRRWDVFRQLYAPGCADLWWSGMGAGCGAFLVNSALQNLPTPVAVAVRNTSPWFALALAPLLLGTVNKPSRWVWASTLLLTCGMLLIVGR